MSETLTDYSTSRARRAATAATACLLTILTSPASAADDTTVAEQLTELTSRLQRLERRNEALESEVRQLRNRASAAAAAEADAPGPVCEQQPAAGAVGTAAVSAAATEPATPAAVDAFKVSASLAAVVQRINAAGAEDERRNTRINYRGDVVAELPAGSVGSARASALVHVRFGQGTGVTLGSTHTSTVNSTGFTTAGGPDDSYLIVAQAYYQLEWPLGGHGGKTNSRFEFTVGKIDSFGFFDRNAVAGDETGQFLNNAFVHNPLLDSGGDISADAYGFAPGLRMAYAGGTDGWQWAASAGAFGTGSGANFSAGIGKPFTIAQFEVSPLADDGQAQGNYRVYFWTNGGTGGLDGRSQRHSGIGLSLDQQVAADWNLFGRYGHRISGNGRFDDAITLGFEHGGRAWGRESDAAGLAFGRLKSSGVWCRELADLEPAGHLKRGFESVTELYYRVKLNEHLAVTPDLQWIRHPGGDRSAASIKVVGARALVAF